MGTTTTMALPYPAGSDAPDGPGAFFALAQGVENALYETDLGSQVSLASNFAFDTGPGFCAVIKFGRLRVVHFSVYSGTPFTSATTFMTMNVGNRPAGNIWTGGQVWDNGVSVSATFSVGADGKCYVASWYPDSGNDGKVQAVRGTFTYWAAN